MKVLQINTTCGTASTGKIAVDLYRVLEKEGNECKIIYGRKKIPDNFKVDNVYKTIDEFNVLINIGVSLIFDNGNFFRKSNTKKLIKIIDEYNPDIVQLHSLQGYFINVELLLDYLGKKEIPVVATMHDCWNITGRCMYFDFAKCDKWKVKCENCPQKNKYPPSFVLDKSDKNYEIKKEKFNKISNLTIVTPSDWLNRIVKQSFLKNKDVITINNGIDLNKFKPTQGEFRKKHNIEDKFVILGVANIWDKRKGLESFIELSKKLDDRYKIVLVGLNEKQLKDLPESVIGLQRTSSVQELAELYTTANIFFNPTYEDNFPTTNIESIACGTPVITYKTGGSTEIINEKWGYVVEQDDIDSTYKIIKTLHGKNKKTKECLEDAQKYSKEAKYQEYIELYKKLLNK